MKKMISMLKSGLPLFACLISLELTAQTQDTISVQDSILQPTTTAQTAPVEEKTKKEKGDGFNSKTRFGFRAGGVISKQDYETTGLTQEPQSKLGADLGIVVSIPIGGGLLMFQPELHWMQKGYKIDDAGSQGEITSTLNYLEIPLLARINFGGTLKLFAFAGPSFGYLLDGTYEDVNGELDATEYLEEVEYSGHIGVGVGIGTFELDLRYIAGLTDIADSPSLSEVKNSSYGAGITLKF